MDKTNEYGRLYSEITRGYSKELIEKKLYYFKHPTLAEHFNAYTNYDLIVKDAKKRGLPTEEESLKQAIENKYWSGEKESTIYLLTKTIQNLIRTKEKLLYPSQKDDIQKQINTNQAILITYTKERNEVIGFTVEQYAQDKFYDELIVNLSFKNAELTEKLFESSEDYYDISDQDCEKIKEIFLRYSVNFSHENIKHVAATGFFQNLIYLNDDPFRFWGKPVINCSKYQNDLLVYGKMYRKAIEGYAQNGKPISDEIANDPDKFVLWFDNQQGGSSESKIRKRKSGSSENTVSSFVGATKEDLNKMGVKIEKLGGKSLLQIANERGGVMEKSDYLSARENN